MIDFTWQENAACEGMDTQIFFPIGRTAGRALRVCAKCPQETKKACLRHALTVPEEFGVWGGTTETERSEFLASIREVTQ